MDEERNRPDVGASEARPGGRGNDAFARWSAARARVREHGALRERDGGDGFLAAAQPGAEDLGSELERERRLRVSAEGKIRDVVAALQQERALRRAAEERADAVFAELELASQAAHDITPHKRRRLRLRRAFLRMTRPSLSAHRA